MSRRPIVIGDVFSCYVVVDETPTHVKLHTLDNFGVIVAGNPWHERGSMNPGVMTFAGPVPWWNIEDPEQQ